MDIVQIVESETLSVDEKKAAIIAYKVLKSNQSIIEVLDSYLLTRYKEANPCSAFPINRESAEKLGIDPFSSEARLLTCIDFFIKNQKQ